MKGEMTKMQTSFNIQDGTGSELLEQLNNAFKSLATNNSGGTEPEETYGGMFWLDTSQTNKILKQRTADNTAWITFGEIDENGLFHSANTLASDDESVTKKGNIFNAANKLVLLNEQGALPELDGSLLTLPTKATTSLNNLTADGEARFDCKVNTDGSNLTNVSNAFKAKIVNWGIPDYDSRINTGKQTPYTAPCDGLFVYSNNATDSYMGTACVNGFLVSTLRAYTTDCFPVAKNDVITLTNTPQITTTYFVPMKGEINTNV